MTQANSPVFDDIDVDAEAAADAEAEADLEAGRVVSHEAVKAWLLSWDRLGDYPDRFRPSDRTRELVAIGPNRRRRCSSAQGQRTAPARRRDPDRRAHRQPSHRKSLCQRQDLPPRTRVASPSVRAWSLHTATTRIA